MNKQMWLAAALVPLGLAAAAEDAHQPYAGLETREIATLSADDIADLTAGRGWGLALAAELNGYPGPAHVLELSEELSLSHDQIVRMEKIFEDMQTDARVKGGTFIAAERALNDAFQNGELKTNTLASLVSASGQARAELRLVHLTRHLQTLDILTAEQVMQYNLLRGYSDDPCESVPEGHNAIMWRLHNGCED